MKSRLNLQIHHKFRDVSWFHKESDWIGDKCLMKDYKNLTDKKAQFMKNEIIKNDNQVKWEKLNALDVACGPGIMA